MFGLTGAAADYAFAIPGVAIVIVFALLFMKMNEKNLQEATKREQIIQSNQEKMQLNQERMLDKTFEQIKEIQESTIQNIGNNTVVAAGAAGGAAGEKIVAGIAPGLALHHTELIKINETLVKVVDSNTEFKQEIKKELKERYEKNQAFNLEGFKNVESRVDKVELQIGKVEGKLDKLLLATPPPFPIPPGNLNVDLHVSEKLPS